MSKRPVTIYYLELASRRDFRPAPNKGPELVLSQARRASPAFSRFLYCAVGGDWYWTDRLVWDEARWLSHLARPGLETWVAYQDGTPVGYFELDKLAAGRYEILYFGVVPSLTGAGCGGYLLSCAVERCYALGAQQILVNTCSLDHVAALANYRARGFRLLGQEQFEKELPEQPPGPWPHARP